MTATLTQRHRRCKAGATPNTTKGDSMAKAAAGGGADSSVADELRKLGVKGVLVRMAEPRERPTVPRLVQQPGLWMADAGPDAARERQVSCRDCRCPEPQGCPPGPRYEPMDGRHGARGLRVLGRCRTAERPKWSRPDSAQPASAGTSTCSASPGEMRMSPRTGRSPEFQTVWGMPRGTKTRAPAVTATSRSPSWKVASPSAT